MTKERFSGDVFTKLIEIVDFIFKAVFFYQYLAIFLTRITSYTIIYTISIQYIMGQPRRRLWVIIKGPDK
jgi:hypothetical protein